MTSSTSSSPVTPSWRNAGETYFVAHDSDPQNLHATGISFREVNDTLTNKLRAATVVLFADACHAGGIGWTSDPSAAFDGSAQSRSARREGPSIHQAARIATERTFLRRRALGRRSRRVHLLGADRFARSGRTREGRIRTSIRTDRLRLARRSGADGIETESTNRRQFRRLAADGFLACGVTQ